MLLESGQDIEQWITAPVVAANLIQVYGDEFNDDSNGSVVLLYGSWTAPQIQMFGNTHSDTFNFEQTQFNGNVIVYGGNVATPPSTPSNPNSYGYASDNAQSQLLTGDDTFNVYTLPTLGGAASDMLTLDGLRLLYERNRSSRSRGAPPPAITI